MLQEHVNYNLHKYFFSNRVIQTWNRLFDSVITSHSTISFKNNLEKFWFKFPFAKITITKFQLRHYTVSRGRSDIV